jgi:hypothetical protein
MGWREGEKGGKERMEEIETVRNEALWEEKRKSPPLL